MPASRKTRSKPRPPAVYDTKPVPRPSEASEASEAYWFSTEGRRALREEIREIGYEAFMEKCSEDERPVAPRKKPQSSGTTSPSPAAVYHAFRLPSDPTKPPSKSSIIDYKKTLPGLCARELRTRRLLTPLTSLSQITTLIQTSRRILVLLGAGASTSSGYPDFRTPTSGLLSQLEAGGHHSASGAFQLSAFRRSPKLFYAAMKLLLANLPSSQAGTPTPPATHAFLRKLQERGKLLRCYSQNVDGLEAAAGLDGERVVLCHGSLETASCAACRTVHTRGILGALRRGTPVRCRSCATGYVKPDVVLHGEPLPARTFELYERDRQEEDLVLVIGTSLGVAPVAGMVPLMPQWVPQVWVNRERWEGSRLVRFDGEVLGDADMVVRVLEGELGWGDGVEEGTVVKVEGASNVFRVG